MKIPWIAITCWGLALGLVIFGAYLSRCCCQDGWAVLCGIAAAVIAPCGYFDQNLPDQDEGWL